MFLHFDFYIFIGFSAFFSDTELLLDFIIAFLVLSYLVGFSVREVRAKSRFTSHFLHDFINGKCATSTHNDTTPCHTEGVARSISNLESRDISPTAQYDRSPSKSQSNTLFELESTQDVIPTKPLEFSAEAKAVFSAGLELWRYYHAVASDTTSPQSLANPHSPYNPNASLYDIKEFFKGRKSTTNATNTDTKSQKQGKLNATSKDLHFNSLMASLNDALANLAKKLESKIYEYGFLEE